MRFARLSTGNGKHLTVTELMAARDMWVKYVQRIHGKEMENDGKPLGVFRNEDSVMRCAGRYNNAELPIDTKYPILLPKTNGSLPWSFSRISNDHSMPELIIRWHKFAMSSGYLGVVQG